MTRSRRVPAYRRQKSRIKDKPDRAFVELNGERIYLGVYDSAEKSRGLPPKDRRVAGQ